ncbi:MAG: dimethylamine monooxygenase subunit DmmA family protein [Pseudomonas sp.]|nr:dimethylamine monooxygenase subunit DmmA family protein [Pseudomonas sp.]
MADAPRNQHKTLPSVPCYRPTRQRPGSQPLVVRQGDGQPLQERLKQAHMGLHLIIEGDEAFIWKGHRLGREHGLQASEIDLLLTDASTRPVYCVHCTTTQNSPLADTLTCQHCGVGLEVRTHFSQRLGAYLGVCRDADQPFAEARP